MHNVEEIVSTFNLQPHPEGGYYREVYRSGCTISGDALPECFNGADRSASTAIYFLLTEGQFSAFHRIKSDEIWHHYQGTALEIMVIDEAGTLTILNLGHDYSSGEQPMQIVKAGSWFASRVSGMGYALVGCTVSPGFDFADFQMAGRESLTMQYPQHSKLIAELTRG